MVRRVLFERIAPRLTGRGFKILLDLASSSPEPLRIAEIPFRFHARVAGKSKLDVLVLAQFVALLLDKAFGGLLPLRFISFALVGALGVLVHLAVLILLRGTGWLPFEAAQAIATVVAMVFNFQLNNEVTYRDQRLRGARLWRGLLIFMLVCGVGAIANVGIAQVLYAAIPAGAFRARSGPRSEWCGITRFRRRWFGADGEALARRRPGGGDAPATPGRGLHPALAR